MNDCPEIKTFRKLLKVKHRKQAWRVYENFRLSVTKLAKSCHDLKDNQPLQQSLQKDLQHLQDQLQTMETSLGLDTTKVRPPEGPTNDIEPAGSEKQDEEDDGDVLEHATT